MKLSIITVNLNNASGLEKTINSVKNQTINNHEYIVIDGGSTDNSIEIIKNNTQFITKWISEKDSGIYNAMNKGISMANGEYIQFLNSGDELYDNNVIDKLYKLNTNKDIIYGDYSDTFCTKVFKMPHSINFRFFYKQSLNHQASFIKKDLFIKYGLYKENIPIIADWDFFMRVFFKHNASAHHIPNLLIKFDFDNSISNNPETLKLINTTRNQVLNQQYGYLVSDMKYIDLIENSTTYKILKKITYIKSLLKK